LINWWNAIPSFEKTFWYFAIPFSIVFIIQTIATLSGLDGGGDLDQGAGDFDGDVSGLDEGGNEGSGEQSAFNLFTVRNFIIFFTIFGWTGIAALNSGISKGITLLLAIISGLVVMFIVAGIFYSMSKLVESGNMNLRNAINSIGEVYLPIPGNRSGMGKIQINLQGTLSEIDAVTNGKLLKTGEIVRVTDIINNQVLIVEKNNKD